MKNKLPDVTRNVEKLLRDYPEARNSDKVLVMAYMARHHGITTFWQASSDPTAPSFESIRRARQKIQACGQYPPVKEIADCRRENEVEYHRQFGG